MILKWAFWRGQKNAGKVLMYSKNTFCMQATVFIREAARALARKRKGRKSVKTVENSKKTNPSTEGRGGSSGDEVFSRDGCKQAHTGDTLGPSGKYSTCLFLQIPHIPGESRLPPNPTSCSFQKRSLRIAQGGTCFLFASLSAGWPRENGKSRVSFWPRFP